MKGNKFGHERNAARDNATRSRTFLGGPRYHGNRKMFSGKYAGYTFSEIARKDMSYTDWVVDKSSFPQFVKNVLSVERAIVKQEQERKRREIS